MRFAAESLPKRPTYLSPDERKSRVGVAEPARADQSQCDVLAGARVDGTEVTRIEMDVTVVADEIPFAEVDGCLGGWFREGARVHDLEVSPGEFLDRALELDLFIVDGVEHFHLVAAS